MKQDALSRANSFYSFTPPEMKTPLALWFMLALLPALLDARRNQSFFQRAENDGAAGNQGDGGDVVWRDSAGKAGLYVFQSGHRRQFGLADQEGTLIRFDDGKQVWKIKTGQALSGSVGADHAKVAVGSPKGDLLVFSAADGQLLWKAKATSEILGASLAKGWWSCATTIVWPPMMPLTAKLEMDFQRPMPAFPSRNRRAPARQQACAGRFFQAAS